MAPGRRLTVVDDPLTDPLAAIAPSPDADTRIAAPGSGSAVPRAVSHASSAPPTTTNAAVAASHATSHRSVNIPVATFTTAPTTTLAPAATA